MNIFCQTVCCMLPICPQLGVGFLADSTSKDVLWNAKPLKMRQVLRVLGQLASDNVHRLRIMRFSVGLSTTFQVPNFLFSCLLYGNMVEENSMYQKLLKVCRKNVYCIKNVRANLGKISFEPPKNCLLLHL